MKKSAANSGLSVAALRRATELQKHSETLQRQLDNTNIALNRVLGNKVGATVTMAGIRAARAGGLKPVTSKRSKNDNLTATGRPRNAMTMHDAIAKVCARSPKSLDEIVAGITKLGYKFAAKRPAHSVGAFLYGPLGKKAFRNVDARFSPKKK